MNHDKVKHDNFYLSENLCAVDEFSDDVLGMKSCQGFLLYTEYLIRSL